jgi:sulfur-oxidizing protein SoxA
MLSLTAYLGFLARGRPIAEPIGERERAFQQAGQALFETRMGQFNLSCAQCHDGLAGQRLSGSIIPQGHPNGYPQYRLEWQTLGSLHRRIRNCLTGVRAEALAADSDDFLALELFLHRRAHGLVIETPAVRP